MNQAIENIEIIKDRRAMGMNTSKFIVWLFIVSITMLFAALTSAYIVKQSGGEWLNFNLPGMFWITSVIIIVSSITMQLALSAARADRFKGLRTYLIVTALLGLAFLIGQYESWKQLVEMDVYFVGNPAGSFLYVLTGLHAVHIISGLIFLLIVIVSSFKLKIHSRSLIRIEMCTTYWHFLGGLWLYLFLFLKMNH
ncbi:MAG: cytochrome c oxidase subunit 3 [Cyclobacteriaceae bacterium]|jgi:cytochrome c oxidase subunit 3